MDLYARLGKYFLNHRGCGAVSVGGAFAVFKNHQGFVFAQGFQGPLQYAQFAAISTSIFNRSMRRSCGRTSSYRVHLHGYALRMHGFAVVITFFEAAVRGRSRARTQIRFRPFLPTRRSCGTYNGYPQTALFNRSNNWGMGSNRCVFLAPKISGTTPAPRLCGIPRQCRWNRAANARG